MGTYYNYLEYYCRITTVSKVLLLSGSLMFLSRRLSSFLSRAGARTLIGGGGGGVFIYSGYARLISFEINFISKETSLYLHSVRLVDSEIKGSKW